MPELRKDPISGTWVIIAGERSKRPSDFTESNEKKQGGFCPFCYGNEDKTPPEVLAYRATGLQGNGPGWSVRVVPNKFAAVQAEGEINPQTNNLYQTVNAIGAHEVVIESPDHNASLGSLPVAQVERVMRALRERFRTIGQDPRIRYIQVFKNSGGTAGASLEHSHWQIIAIPLVPKVVEQELANFREHYALHRKCLFCDLIAQELADNRRIVYQGADFLIFCPHASRFPYELWIAPQKHLRDFGEMGEGELTGLARAVKIAAGKLETAFNHPPYNIVLHTVPVQKRHELYYHWHLEILPRLTITAGFEWGTGYFINPTSPEMAAQVLRDVQLAQGSL